VQEVTAEAIAVAWVDQGSTRDHQAQEAAAHGIPVAVVKRPTAKQGFVLPRRWVEWTLAWLSKCRGLLLRYDKKAIDFFGLLQLACALIWMRRGARLIGN
jgi:hypothetical protein